MGAVNPEPSLRPEEVSLPPEHTAPELWKILITLVPAGAGYVLAKHLQPEILGIGLTVSLWLLYLSCSEVRQLKRRLASLTHKKAEPAPVSPAHTPPPSTSEPMDGLHYSVLCVIVDAHDEDRVVKSPDIQQCLRLKKSSLEPAIFWLDQEKYIWEEGDESLEDDPGALHPLPKALSYVTSRRNNT